MWESRSLPAVIVQSPTRVIASGFFCFLASLAGRLRTSRPVGLIRYHTYRALLAFPRRVQCNLCGWRGRRFLSYLHRDVLCPNCGSQVRHRLIAAALDLRPDRTHNLSLAGRRIVHLSPEYCLAERLRPDAGAYIAADYAADAGVRVDATRLPFRTASVDVFVACDVLEHIVAERAALDEIRRVLRPTGVAVLTVPQVDDLAATFEDPSVVTPEARTSVYGQPDHVRNYGTDFPERVAAAGFDVSAVDAEALPRDAVARHVLKPPTPLTTGVRFNYRAIVFARPAEAPITRV